MNTIVSEKVVPTHGRAFNKLSCVEGTFPRTAKSILGNQCRWENSQPQKVWLYISHSFINALRRS